MPILEWPTKTPEERAREEMEDEGKGGPWDTNYKEQLEPDNDREKVKNAEFVGGRGMGRYSEKEIGVDEEFQEEEKIISDIRETSRKSGDERQAAVDGLKNKLQQLKERKGAELAESLLRRAGDRIIDQESSTDMLKILTDLTRSF